jgi:chromosomal replication initiation ATPase DnaA
MNTQLVTLKSLMKSQLALMKKIEMLLKDEPVKLKSAHINKHSDRIIDAVNKEFQTICTVSVKNKQVSDARAVAMYFLNKYTKLNLTEIALATGRNNHTTVIAARDKVLTFIQIYPDFKEKVDRIEQELIK